MWIDDNILDNCSRDVCLQVWVPEQSFVVLGSGNQAKSECNLKQCDEDGIEIRRRYGGGGTVLLHSGCIIVSYGCWVKNPYQNDLYFDLLNSGIIDSLGRQWPRLLDLEQKGISDIAYKGRKVCGTSLFRSRNFLLYQASILIDDKADEISRYLAHPSKEPDYREGKSHEKFLTYLSEIDSSISPLGVKNIFLSDLEEILAEKLEAEFISPDPRQIKHILARASKGRRA